MLHVPAAAAPMNLARAEDAVLQEVALEVLGAAALLVLEGMWQTMTGYVRGGKLQRHDYCVFKLTLAHLEVDS